MLFPPYFILLPSSFSLLPPPLFLSFFFIFAFTPFSHSSLSLLLSPHLKDIEGAMTPSEISTALGLSALKNRTWAIFKTSAIKGEGLEEAMEWYDKLESPYCWVVVLFLGPFCKESGFRMHGSTNNCRVKSTEQEQASDYMFLASIQTQLPYSTKFSWVFNFAKF